MPLFKDSKYKFKIVLILLLISKIIYAGNKYDLTLIGIAAMGDGISAITTGFAAALYNDLKINSPWPTPFLNELPKHLRPIFANNENYPGNVLIYNNVLHISTGKNYMELPKSKIKIAYSMVEGHGVPPVWVQALNSSFDAVVVPDDFLIDVYKNSGVNIPTFVLPICLPLGKLLVSSKNHVSKPFTFGSSGAFIARKNQKMLIEAFVKKFGNNPNFQLKIHGRMFEQTDVTLKELRDYIKDRNISNVIIDNQNLNRSNYIEFLKSIDCYVFLSRGEGFSITPREAMALGIPCILSNNTAQQTLCKTHFVRAVNCLPGTTEVALNDVCDALEDVFNNYSHYKDKGIDARKWVSQYTAKNLHDKYLNLVKPKKIILGDKNEITNDYLQTNSLSLFKKYKSLN